MSNLLFLFKKHFSVFILAVIFGAMMIAPFFYFQTKLGNNFRGILPEIVNDENFYYARIKDVIDGHSFLNNAYLVEHKEGLPQQLFLAEYVLAQPLKLFNINIQTGHLIYNFLLPVISFLLVYAAFYLILRRRFWSLIFSSFLFFGLYLIIFIRPVSPQFNFIFWLTQFIFLWLFLEKRSKKFLFLSSLNFGLLFYIYPYYWTFYLIFFGILIAAYFWKNRGLALKIAAITAGGLILAIPYFYLNYLVSLLPYYTETLTRLGMIYSRFPSGMRIVSWSLLALLVFGLVMWRKFIKLETKFIFFISGILASIIAVNQHLITGRNIEFSSHYSMGAIFFLVFAAAYLWQKLRERQNNLKLLSVILLVTALAASGSGLYGYSKRAFAINEENIYIQNYTSVFEWLNKNTEKDSVVYSNADLSGLIPVYTANNVYYAREANLFFISDKEVLDRFILNNFFSAKGGSASGGEYFNRDFIIGNVRSIYGVRYIDAYGHAVQGNKLRRIFGLKPEPEIYLPEDAVQKVLSRAKELQSGDFIRELNQYRVDYLIWDKNKNPEWKIDSKFFSKDYSVNGIIIYRLK